MARVVVVGAGIAGLSTAIRLADFGHDVVILERAAEPGGQLGPITGSTTASTTASATGSTTGSATGTQRSPIVFTLPAVLRDLFRKTGKTLERCVTMQPAATGRHHIFTDGSAITLPNADRGGTAHLLDEQIGDNAGQQWSAAMRTASGYWEVLRTNVVHRPFSSRDAARLALRRATRDTMRGSLRDFARQQFPDSRLRTMLEAHAWRLGADPAQAPAALAALAYVEHTFGLWTIDGGADALIQAMAERASERGAELRLGAAATEVEHRDNKVTAVRTDDDLLHADIVVSTVSAELGFGSARPGRALPRSVFTVVLDDDRSDPPLTSTVADESGAPTVTVDALPDKAAAAHVVCADADWHDPGTISAQTTRVSDLLKQRTGAAPRVRYVRTPVGLGTQTGAPGGRVFGHSWLTTRNARSSPPNKDRIEGLFHAGAAVHPGPTIPLAVMSADIVSDLIGRA